MKNRSTTQEILLMTNTKFSAREYSEKNGQSAKPEPSQKQKLAEACWNGLLTEMLPEICMTKNKKPLTLWELGQGRNMLYLQLGDVDTIPDVSFTLNPYALAETMCGN